MAAISRVFFNKAAATSASLSGSGVAAGDYIVVFAYRNATTAPSLITGYTSIATNSGNSNSCSMMYKVATGSETTTGVATNANVVLVGIYRNVGGIGKSTNANHAANSSLIIPSFVLARTDGTSWVVEAGGSRQTTSQGSFTTYTTEGTQVGTTSFGIFGDTNGGVATYSGDTSANGSSVVYAYAAVELIGIALFETLTDDFTGVTIDTTKWNTVSKFGTVTQNGSLTLSNGISYTGYNGIDSLATYNLTGSYAFVQLTDVGNEALVSWEVNPITLIKDTNNTASFYINQGSISAQTRIANVSTFHNATTYNSVTMQYLRIRESAGTTYWDYSADASSWTNLYSVANPFAMTSLTQEFVAGTFSAEASATSCTFDNFNVTPPPSGTQYYSFLPTLGAS